MCTDQYFGSVSAMSVASSNFMMRCDARGLSLVLHGYNLASFVMAALEQPLPGDARLVREQPALGLDAAAEAGERAVAADDAVARHDDGDGIGSVRGADGAHGVGMPDVARDGAVHRGRAVRDGAQAAPHALLKGGAVDREREVEVAQLAGEVRAQLRHDAAQRAVVADP